MPSTAKLFTNGRSQTVRLPAAYRFEGTEADPTTGDVILWRRPPSWDGFFAALGEGRAPADFLGVAKRAQGEAPRDPFEDWTE